MHLDFFYDESQLFLRQLAHGALVYQFVRRVENEDIASAWGKVVGLGKHPLPIQQNPFFSVFG